MKRITVLAILVAILMVGVILPASAQATQIGELFVRNHSQQYIINFFLDGAFIGQLGPLTESHLMIPVGIHTISGVCATNTGITWGPNQFTMTVDGFVHNYWDSATAVPVMTWFNVINRSAVTITSINLDGIDITVNIPPQTQSTIRLTVGQHMILATGSGGSWGPFSFYDTTNGWNWTLSSE